jgi:hypothetical protein
MGRPKRVVVSLAAVKAAGRRNTRASARLEGHEVPPDHPRSPAVERFLTARMPKAPGEARFGTEATPGRSQQDSDGGAETREN